MIANLESDSQKIQNTEVIHSEPAHQKVNELEFFGSVSIKALQICTSAVSYQFVCNTNIAFVGNLNDADLLAAVGLGDMLIFFTGGLLFVGLNEGFTSLAGRAFGAQSYRMVGSYLHKAFFLLVIMFSIFFLITIFSENILTSIGQPAVPSQRASVYLKFLLPSLLFSFIFDTLRAYLNCMKIYHVHSITNVVTACLHPLFCYLLIDIGYYGVAIACCITQFLNVCSLVIYIIVQKPYPETLFFDFSCIWPGLKSYVVYVSFTAFPILIDLFFIGFKTLIVGTFDDANQIAAHVTVAHIFGLLYSFFIGVNAALVALSSNAIGERDVQQCKMLYRFCYYFGFVIGGTFLIVLLVFQDNIFRFYTQNKPVIIIMRVIYHIMLPIVIFDYLQCAVQGVLKGVGLGKQASFATVFSYWVVGIPTVLILCYGFDLEVRGVWFGFAASIVTLCLLSIFFVQRIDWEQHIKEKEAELNQHTIESFHNLQVSDTQIPYLINSQDKLDDNTPLVNDSEANKQKYV